MISNQEIFRLLDNNEFVSSYEISGNHEIVWNGKNESGKLDSSGIYFYKIKVKDKMISKKMLLLK
ncbi:MAG: hypothetical protein H8D45_03765 [Bacteroidetes bacterium]|nr:hypothetical protein [Bacteroidota bacterium]